jgi:cytochrome P450
LIQEYVSLLIHNLREDAANDKEVNIVQAFNLTTFDIVSDLSFGESFNGLKTRTAHPWIGAFFYFTILRTVMIQFALLKIPLISKLVGILVFPLANKRLGTMNYASEMIAKRIDEKTDRPDFMSYVLRHNDEKGMSRAEIQATFNLLMIAGSETTATLLAGCTYLLQKNPRVLQKLLSEIRESFSDEEQITMVSVGQMKYLDAVIEESLRLYPPVPIALNRSTPPEGATICGFWVPGNVSLPLSICYVF